jgi:Ca-activated chloride channel family protein
LSFRSPWGLLALLLIVPVVLLYILKKQHEDRTVSSIMLWQQVLRDLQAARPWQRLRTRLLLLLQILAVLLFALSLARPACFGGEGGVHYIAVLDASARMQATDIRPSRLEYARSALLNLIQGMKARDTMTVVQAGGNPFVLVGPSNDKGALRQYVNEIQPSNGKSDLDSAVQLARTLLQDQGEEFGQIHVYSDHLPHNSGNQKNLLFHIAAGNGQNAAITHVGYEIGDGMITALSRAVNYGSERSVTLELMIDGTLQNVKEVHLPAGEEVNVYWSDIPPSAREITVSISEEDDLMLDNIGTAAVNEEYQIKALLITERNVFLERALSLRKDIELFKVNPAASPLESSDFQLYIYDGAPLPEQLPQDGHIIAFSSAAHEEIGLTTEGEIHPVGITINPESLYPELTQYVQPEGYQIARSVKWNIPEGFTVLLQDNSGNPILIAGEQEGKKIVLFAFSLHESNLPLKADFPILIQNLLNWIVPPDMSFGGQILAGESLQLQPFPDVSHITVTSPTGREYEFAAYPAPVFYDTNEIGVYTISQKGENRLFTGRFSVSVPTEEVSDLRADHEAFSDMGDEMIESAASPFRRDIWMAAGWALLLLLLIEWRVYHHGI